MDAKIAQLNAKVARVKQREAGLEAAITDVTTRIRSLEGKVVDVSTKLDVLQRDLALHQARLDKLNALYELRVEKYAFEKQQYRAALFRLPERPHSRCPDARSSAE